MYLKKVVGLDLLLVLVGVIDTRRRFNFGQKTHACSRKKFQHDTSELSLVDRLGVGSVCAGGHMKRSLLRRSWC
jgi:hypothetical protein